MNPTTPSSLRAQRQQAVQARILKNRNLPDQPQPQSSPLSQAD